MRFAALLSSLVFALAGCQSSGVRLRNAELQTGPRFDEQGEFTDQPEVTIPLWDSDGIRDRPAPITPPAATGKN